MARWWVLFAASLGAASAAELRLVGEAQPGRVVVVRLQAPPTAPGAPPLAAFLARGTELVALPSQWDGRMAEEPLAFWLPADATLDQVRLRTATTPSRVSLPVPLLQLKHDGARLTVEGSTFRVTHEPAKQGGLPSTLELLPAGKRFDTYALNDRVYRKADGGFQLRSDTSPQLDVLAEGPLRVVVRVHARYLNEAGVAPKGDPSATYLFTYLADSPRVEVAAEMSQTGSDWDELHLLEINFADTSFSGWIGGDPLTEGKFVANSQSIRKAWGALVEGDAAVGLASPGGVVLYDGRGGYGTYLHGPWPNWSGNTMRLRSTLILSGRPDARQVVAREARLAAAPPVTALNESAVQALAETLRRADTLPSAVAARARWWAHLARARAEAGEQRLAEKLALAAWAAVSVAKPSPASITRAMAAAGGFAVLASDELGVAVERGRLASLYDLRRQRELLRGAVLPWSLTVREAAGKISEAPEPPTAAASPDGDGRSMTIAYRQTVPAGLLETRLWLQVTGPRLAMRLRVLPGSKAALWQVRFPLVKLGRLGADGTDDRFFFPRGPGQLESDPVGRGVQWRGRYPSGWTSMQYMAVYDRDGGVYIGAEDPVASTKDLYGGGTGDGGTVTYGIEWPVPNMGTPGTGFDTSGKVALELFGGDWFDAARIYRRFAENEAQWWPARAKAKQTPREMRDLAAWACVGATPYEPDNVVSRVKEMAKFMGVPMALHWYSWHQIPFDTNYPHYKPPKPRVEEGVKELQAAGIKVMPYINARLWDQALEDFAQAKPYATTDIDGTLYTEEYGNGVKQAAMCPTTPLWRDTVRDTVLWLQNEVGVDGVYMDQVAAADPRLCFDAKHGHPLGGGCWWTRDGYWPLLARLRAAMPKGKFITTECNADPYMQYFDGYLSWHWQYQDQVPAFSAVYADQVVLFGRSYGGGETREAAARMKAGESLVFGEQIGWIDPEIRSRPAGPFVRDCARLRYRLRPHLAGGTMQRPPKLEGDIPSITADWQWSGTWPITTPALRTGAWRTPDGQETAMIVANVSEQPLTVKYAVNAADLGLRAGSRLTVKLTPADGEPTTLRWRDGETVTLSLPATTVLAWVVSRER
ncbi:MAG: hypothetical protein HZB16_14645 [Armatimonadetes bacterium]|nr:hypothetical protein [Armatimonadota bacterium]